MRHLYKKRGATNGTSFFPATFQPKNYKCCTHAQHLLSWRYLKQPHMKEFYKPKRSAPGGHEGRKDKQ